MAGITRLMAIIGAALALAGAVSLMGCAANQAAERAAAREAEQQRLERERREERIDDLERGKREARERMLNRQE